jgi:hypothetical protein
MRRLPAAIAVLALISTAGIGVATAGPGGANAVATARVAYADWPTYHANRGRTGVGAVPAVTGASKLFATIPLDGAVYASPIVVGGHTIVATENNTVYSFTPGGSLIWKRHLGTPVPRSSLPCGNIDPLGITGTPVYSPASKLIYAVAEVNAPIAHELYAITTTGVVKWHRNIDMPGVTASAMQQRGALTTEGSAVWVPFGGLAGDCGAYKGRLVRVQLDGAGARIRFTVPTTREAGMWTPPGPTVDASGYIYQSVGNGASGVGDPYDFSDSVLKLQGFGHLVSSFSPSTWANDNAADLDLGSQGPALVGKWVFIAGKSGTAYVLRAGALGGIGGQVSQASLCKSFGGTSVVGSTVYVPCTDGLRAVRIDSAGAMHVAWHAASNITGSPVVGGGRIWSLDTGSGDLHALNPSTGANMATVHVGSVTRFATPALYGHLVLVGTTSGYAVVESA